VDEYVGYEFGWCKIKRFNTSENTPQKHSEFGINIEKVLKLMKV
jgi:hypothetical protein